MGGQKETQSLSSQFEISTFPQSTNSNNSINSHQSAPSHEKNSLINFANVVTCHSHRNVKPAHQMLMAESLFEETVTTRWTSRLAKSLPELLADSFQLPYFIQFMETQGPVAKNLIRFCIQNECFCSSLSGANCDTNPVMTEILMQNDVDQYFNDAKGIFEKYISTSAPHHLEVSDAVRNEVLSKIENRQIHPDLFSKCREMAMNKIESDFYQMFQRSCYYCKYQVDILTSGNVYLADILFCNSALLSYFVEFLEQEGMRHYIDFLLTVSNSMQNTTEDSSVDAKIIYKKFIEPNSPSYLGFSDSLRCQISDKMKTDPATCFNKAAAILMQYFEKTYLRQFLESQTYLNYLSESISSIQLDFQLRRKKSHHKRAGSDSSESSFCSGRDVSFSSPHKDKAARKDKQSKLTDQNPDSLWKRDLAGKLQITYVDKYGKIFSELEAEPDKSDSTLVTKAMKRLTNNTFNEKQKEEMAWQVAEMIVNDVCKVTQQDEEMSNHEFYVP